MKLNKHWNVPVKLQFSIILMFTDTKKIINKRECFFCNFSSSSQNHTFSNGEITQVESSFLFFCQSKLNNPTKH